MNANQFPAFFEDEYNIGQEKVAKIRADIAMEEMAKVAVDAFRPGYVNPHWRAMSRRVFYRNRAEYERAKEILGELNAS